MLGSVNVAFELNWGRNQTQNCRFGMNRLYGKRGQMLRRKMSSKCRISSLARGAVAVLALWTSLTLVAACVPIPAEPTMDRAIPAGSAADQAIPTDSTTDRDVLVALYQATSGDSWLQSDNWLTDAPIDSWYGVVADNNDRVIELDLSENGLSGSIPPELGNLINLKSLNLYNNRLSGSIPSELGNLINLETLDFYKNLLRGTIPPELGGLAELEWLELSDNWLRGMIPPELGKLTELEWLGLSNNRLFGAIPPELGMLTRLEWLDLSGNGLTGAIPSELGKLTKLSELYLSGNQLNGCVPEVWRNVEMSDLERLELPFCGDR